MVRSLSRGQFHVTSAWDGLGPAAVAAQDDPYLGEFPLPDEDRDPEYPAESAPDEPFEGLLEPLNVLPEAPTEAPPAAPIPERDRSPVATATAPETVPASPGAGSGLVALEPPQPRPLESGPVTLELLETPDQGDTSPTRVASDPAEGGSPTHRPTSGERTETDVTTSPLSPSVPGNDASPASAGAARPGSSEPSGPSVAAAPAGVDPSRTLVGLLARMWLMRSSGPTSGAVAAPPSTPPPPVAATALAKDVTSTALAPLRERSLLPPASPGTPATPSVPQVPPSPPAPASRPADSPPRPLAGPADPDDRWPVSGVGTFMVEVAGLAYPQPAASPSPPVPPPSMAAPSLPPAPPASLPRARLVFQLVHCPHPIPEQAVSRSSCRQRRVGES